MKIVVLSTLVKAWNADNRRVRLFFALALGFGLACGGAIVLWRSGTLGAGAAGTAAFLHGALSAACVAAICTFQAMVERKQGAAPAPAEP